MYRCTTNRKYFSVERWCLFGICQVSCDKKKEKMKRESVLRSLFSLHICLTDTNFNHSTCRIIITVKSSVNKSVTLIDWFFLHSTTFWLFLLPSVAKLTFSLYRSQQIVLQHELVKIERKLPFIEIQQALKARKKDARLVVVVVPLPDLITFLALQVDLEVGRHLGAVVDLVVRRHQLSTLGHWVGQPFGVLRPRSAENEKKEWEIVCQKNFGF